MSTWSPKYRNPRNFLVKRYDSNYLLDSNLLVANTTVVLNPVL